MWPATGNNRQHPLFFQHLHRTLYRLCTGRLPQCKYLKSRRCSACCRLLSVSGSLAGRAPLVGHPRRPGCIGAPSQPGPRARVGADAPRACLRTPTWPPARAAPWHEYALTVPMDLADGAILQPIEQDVLDPSVVETAIDLAVEDFARPASSEHTKREQVLSIDSGRLAIVYDGRARRRSRDRG